MNQYGRVVILKETVVTSASTFVAHGMLRNTLRIIKVRLWFGLGRDPQEIYDYYYSKK